MRVRFTLIPVIPWADICVLIKCNRIWATFFWFSGFQPPHGFCATFFNLVVISFTIYSEPIYHFYKLISHGLIFIQKGKMKITLKKSRRSLKSRFPDHKFRRPGINWDNRRSDRVNFARGVFEVDTGQKKKNTQEIGGKRP